MQGTAAPITGEDSTRRCKQPAAQPPIRQKLNVGTVRRPYHQAIGRRIVLWHQRDGPGCESALYAQSLLEACMCGNDVEAEMGSHLARLPCRYHVNSQEPIFSGRSHNVTE